jgi:hypothetical protein
MVNRVAGRRTDLARAPRWCKGLVGQLPGRREQLGKWGDGEGKSSPVAAAFATEEATAVAGGTLQRGEKVERGQALIKPTKRGTMRRTTAALTGNGVAATVVGENPATTTVLWVLNLDRRQRECERVLRLQGFEGPCSARNALR